MRGKCIRKCVIAVAVPMMLTAVAVAHHQASMLWIKSCEDNFSCPVQAESFSTQVASFSTLGPDPKPPAFGCGATCTCSAAWDDADAWLNECQGGQCPNHAPPYGWLLEWSNLPGRCLGNANGEPCATDSDCPGLDGKCHTEESLDLSLVTTTAGELTIMSKADGPLRVWFCADAEPYPVLTLSSLSIDATQNAVELNSINGATMRTDSGD